jgi:hypothetical protein
MPRFKSVILSQIISEISIGVSHGTEKIKGCEFV